MLLCVVGWSVGWGQDYKHHIIYDSAGPSIGGTRVVKVKGKLGLLRNGVPITDCKYDNVEYVNNGYSFSHIFYYLVKAKDNWGLLDSEGHARIPCIYSSLSQARYVKEYKIYKTFIACKGDNCGLINNSGKIILQPNYKIKCKDDIVIIDSGTNHKGVASYTRGVVVPPIYTDIRFEDWPKFTLLVCDSNRKWGVVDTNNHLIMPLTYDDIDFPREGLLAVKHNGLWGFVNLKGQLQISFLYDYVEPFLKGLAWVQVKGKWGAINRQGEEVVPCIYERPYCRSNGFQFCKLNGEDCVFDSKGNILFVGKDLQREYRGERASFIVVTKRGKTAVAHEDGLFKTDFFYTEVVNSGQDRLIVCSGGKYGLLGAKGVFLPPMYDSLVPSTYLERTLKAKLNEKWGEIDTNGNTLIPCRFDTVDIYDKAYAEVSRNGKKGFYWFNGHKIDCRYDDVDQFYKGHAKVRDGANVYYIDTMGNKTDYVPEEDTDPKTKVNYLGTFSEHRARIQRGNFLGFIDRKGQEIGPLRYTDENDFSEGMAAVELGDKWGYIDTNGRMVIPIMFEAAHSFKQGRAMIYNGLHLGFINPIGQMAIDTIYSGARDFANGLAFLRKNKLWGAVDSNGRTVIPFKYEDVEPMPGELISVSLKGKWGLINKRGKGIIPFVYSSSILYSDGMCSFENKGRYGYIDLHGKKLIPNVFDFAGRFRKGVAFIWGYLYGGSQMGFIDRSGEILVPAMYDYLCYPSDSGIILAKIKGDYKATWRFINIKNERVIPGDFESAGQFSEGLAPVKKDGHWMYIDTKGRVVLSFKNIHQ